MDRVAIARRFPLVRRSRPPGRPLKARISELRQLAQEADAQGEHERMTRACEVCNKAALIASDCGMPQLARELCWRQYDVFDRARPLPIEAAKLALQPVLNIPRQLIREGDGDSAYRMLEQLYQAARARTEAEIAGRRINLPEVTRAPDDHKAVCTLLWAALLADGARALTLAGRWQEAADQAAAYRGVGARLLDGRQVAILALVDRGEPGQAAATVDESVVATPWEQAIASLLRVYCQHAPGNDIAQNTEVMLAHALGLVEQADPSTTVFSIRVGMTALDLADGCDSVQLPHLRTAIITGAAADAYAAREVLEHPQLHCVMTRDQQQLLGALMQASGLDSGTIPIESLDDLLRSVNLAEDQLRTLLERSASRCCRDTSR
jgi:hypothetical protein